MMIARIFTVLFALALAGQFASAQFIDRTSSNDETQRANARRAAITAAQGEVDRAQASLDAANARLRAAWKANPDLLAADRDLAIKQTAFDKARQPILESLKKDPAYQAAADQAKQADHAVKTEQSATTRPAGAAVAATLPAPSDTQVQAATEKLEQKSILRDLEEKAIAADSAASQARVDLDAARAKVKAIQLQFDAAKLNDPEFKAALEGLNAAKSRLTAAAGQN